MSFDQARSPRGTVHERMLLVGWIVTFLALIPILALVRQRLAIPAGVLPTPNLAHGLQLDEIVFGAGTSLGDGAGLVLVMGIVVAGLIALRQYRDALFVAVTVTVAAIVGRLVKDLVDAPRPPTVDIHDAVVIHIPEIAVVVVALVILGGGRLTRWPRLTTVIGLSLLVLLAAEFVADRLVPLTAGSDSFPSGHAMNSMTLACSVALVAIDNWPARRWIVWVAAAYVLLVGVSRIYLGVHYPADVLAGWALAMAWVFACWLVRRRFDHQRPPDRQSAGGSPATP